MNIDSKTHFSKSKVKNIKEVVVNDKMKNNNNVKETQKGSYNQLFPPIATCFAQIPLYMYKTLILKSVYQISSKWLKIVSPSLIKNFARKQTLNELVSFDRF